MMKHEALHLLGHWIEHNESHAKSFRERAKQIREVNAEAAADVEAAADLMDQCTGRLKMALLKM